MLGPAFGFSAGDFISAISLIKTLISALSNSAGSRPQYQRLVKALFNLERALTEVKNLKVTSSQASQKIALDQVAAQCQQTIERFLEENTKFKSTLSLTASSSKWSWRTNVYKIQWAVCKEDAIAGLRAEIIGHTLTINTLLATMQLSSTFLQVEAASNCEATALNHRTVSDDTNALVRDQKNLILSISTQMAKDQSTDLQTIIHKVLDTNMKIYTLILDMQNLQKSVPPQIEREQPILFEDAHGRITPFHTEFIDSFEAFQAVMEVRFQHLPGLRKIQNNEYTIQESLSKRTLDLKAPWNSVFLPGRKCNMSVIFRRPQSPVSSCPGCQTETSIDADSLGVDVHCANPECNLWYQRIVEVNTVSEAEKSVASLSQLGSLSPRKRKKADDEDEDEDEDEIQHFRRVQVVHQRFLHKKPSPEATRKAVVSVDPKDGNQELTETLDSIIYSSVPQPMPSARSVKHQEHSSSLLDLDFDSRDPRYPFPGSMAAQSTWPMPLDTFSGLERCETSHLEDYITPVQEASGLEPQMNALFGGLQQYVEAQIAMLVNWSEIEKAMSFTTFTDDNGKSLGGSTPSGTYLEVLSLSQRRQ